jgi:hypothetical protein
MRWAAHLAGLMSSPAAWARGLRLMALLVGVGALAWSSSLRAGTPRRNVIVIVADDLGTDKVGVYAEAPDPPATPRIDRLAAEGVWFRNAYVSSVCAASRAALLTGRYSSRTGIGGVIDRESPVAGEALVTFMQRVADAFPGKTIHVVWDNLNTHGDGKDAR